MATSVLGLGVGTPLVERIFASIYQEPYVKWISPVNLVESTPPKVTMPFASSAELGGSKEIATRFCAIVP